MLYGLGGVIVCERCLCEKMLATRARKGAMLEDH